MLMTQRAAARLLATIGLSRRHATQVLAAGLAGRPQVTTSSLLYDAAAVDALVARPPLGPAEVGEVCPQGLFVARLGAEQLEPLTGPWGIGAIMATWMRLRIEKHGFVPLVATVGGFVTRGAEIVDLRTRVGADPSRPESTLAVRPASDWLDRLQGRRIARGPGRPWSLVGFDLQGADTGTWEDGPP